MNISSFRVSNMRESTTRMHRTLSLPVPKLGARKMLCALLALVFCVAASAAPMLAQEASSAKSASTPAATTTSAAGSSAAATTTSAAGSPPAATTTSAASSAPAGAAAPAAASAPSKPPPIPYPVETVLPNGLRVIIVEEHSVPIVSCLMWYRAGARNERAGSTGLSHLIEHMLFQNVGSFRKGEMGASIVRNGGQFNGFASDDFTAFFETVHPSKLELALKVESERMRSARFTQSDVQAEIAHIKKEFDEEASDPAAVLASEVRAMLFVHHPYGTPTRGYRPDVEALTAQDAKGYYDRFFHPNNATLVLVGAVRKDAAIAAVKRHFGHLPKSAHPIPHIRAVEPQQRAERRVIVRHPGRREMVYVAYRGPAIADADSAAMAVLEKVLNTANNGRLKTRLLDPRICGAVTSAFELKRDPGLLTISTISANGVSLRKVLDGIDGMVSQLRTQPVSDSELRRARNQAEFACFNERDGAYRTGFHIGYFDSLQNWKAAYTWPERLRTVTAADVLNVARKYLNPDTRVVGFLHSAGAGAAPAAVPAPSKPSPPAQSAPQQPPKQTTPKGAHASRPQYTPLAGYKHNDSDKEPYPLLAVNPGASKGKAPAAASAAAKPAEKRPAAASAAAKPAEKKPAAASAAAKPAEKKPASKADDKKPTAAAKPAPGQGAAQKSATASMKADDKKAGAGHQTGNQPGHQAGRQPGHQTGSQPGHQAAEPGAARVMAGSHLKIGHYTRKVLKNGLTVIAFENRLSPIVQISGAIRAGEVLEPRGKNGVSTLAAAALNYGTPKLNKTQLTNLQEDLGLPPQAMLKFTPGQEFITFQARFLSRDLTQALALVADALRDPAYAEGDLEKAKQDAINDIKEIDGSVSSRVNRALLRTLVAQNTSYYPADLNERGKSIDALKSADVKEFDSQFITPEATTVVIAGDIHGEEAIRQAEAALSGWEPGGKIAAEPDVVHNNRRLLKVSVPVRDRSQTMVCVGKLLNLSQYGPDFSNLLIADCALTNHPIFSRLVQRVNDEAVLATSLSADELDSRFQPMGRLTAWSLVVPVDAQRAGPAVEAVKNELREFVRVGLNANDIAEIKRYLAGALPVRNMQNLTLASRSVLEAALHRAEGDYLGELLLKVRNANPESINRFIRNTFRPDQSTLIIAGDHHTVKQIQAKSARDVNPVLEAAEGK